MSHRVLVTTVPFAEPDRRPRDLLSGAGVHYEVQGLGRRLTEHELADLAPPFSVLIAGTEPITERVMDAAPNLRLIARVGIGLDGVDLVAARDRGIAVSFTPDAPSPAVAELTVGLMLNLARHTIFADRSLRAGSWKRFMGRRLADATVGVIGVGRIGTRVIRILRNAFPSIRILAHDIAPDEGFGREHDVEWVDKEELLAASDFVTVHVPLTPLTRQLIGARELTLMKPTSVLVNTARGGVVAERALVDALRGGTLAAAAVDVFEQEPYAGELTAIPNCILTCHMGSMTEDCRTRMETEAVEEAVRFIQGQPLLQPVPDVEYDLRAVLS
jgi:D-3-phosphoglycerate dehydrogenase